MVSKLVLTYRDNTSEMSTATFQGANFTAGNLVAQEGLQDAIVTAIAGIADGVLAKTVRVAAETEGSASVPAVGVQREVKFMARWHAGTEQHRTEIPCADLSQLVSGTEQVNLAAGAGLAFKTAFDAYVVGDDGVTAGVLDSLTFVTRNT